jgi:tetratricopeptide (TPR) repeat protein
MNRLALSMIVKDAARFLPQCLTSVRGVVTEIVIADTGSADSTIQIAESFGARVLQIPWKNDFAAARNSCLAHVRSEWVLSLDADEMLDDSAASSLPPLLSATPPAAYQVTIRNFVLSLQDRIWDRPAIPNNCSLPAGKPYPAYADHQNVRLFRNLPDLRFVGRVHESVGPSLLKQKLPIASADFLIYHFGLALAAEERAAKNRFYRDLGRQKLLEMPTDAQAHLELGIVEMDNFANLPEALQLFSTACRLNPRLATAWFFQGLVLHRLDRFAEALRCLEKSQALGHSPALVAEISGDALYNSGAFAHAVRSYQSALQREPSNPWLASKLGLALVRTGETVAGIRHLNSAIQTAPEAGELHDRITLAHLSRGNLAEAAESMEAKLSSVLHPTAGDFLRAASLCSKSKRIPRALQLISLGLDRFPEDKKLLLARSELHQLLSAEPLPLISTTS